MNSLNGMLTIIKVEQPILVWIICLVIKS